MYLRTHRKSRQQSDYFFQTPNMVSNARFHCWRDTQGLMNAFQLPLATASVSLLRMSNGAAETPKPSKAQIFLRRLTTSVVLWTVIIAALFSGHELLSDGV